VSRYQLPVSGQSTRWYFCTGLPEDLFSNQKFQLGKFLRAFDWKMRIQFIMVIWNIYGLLVFYDHLVEFVCIHLVPFSVFGITHQEKSGNRAFAASTVTGSFWGKKLAQRTKLVLHVETFSCATKSCT
jgi:hypothetical protein